MPIKFIGYSKEELSIEFKQRMEELDKTSSLTVLSALEASFRIDYLKRCYQKEKDALSRIMREIYKKKGHHVSLEDDIFDTWKKYYPKSKNMISELLGAFKYRHWLAHGRYWEPKLGRKYDYHYIYALAEQIDNTLPLLK